MSPPPSTCRKSTTPSTRRKKEIAQRYDFKGSKSSIDFKRAENVLDLVADDTFKMEARLGHPPDAPGPARRAGQEPQADATSSRSRGGLVKRTVTLQQGIPTDAARDIVKFLKDQKLKKVQAAIQGDQLRVSSPSKDELQGAIRLLQVAGFRRGAAVRQLPRVTPDLDVAIVGAGAAGLATAIFAKRRHPQRARRAASRARRLPARRSSSAAAPAATSPTPSSPRRTSTAAARRRSGACCARFPSPTPSRSSARSACRFTKSRAASCFPTATDRATCSTRCCAKSARVGAELRTGHRVARRRARDGGFRGRDERRAR